MNRSKKNHPLGTTAVDTPAFDNSIYGMTLSGKASGGHEYEELPEFPLKKIQNEEMGNPEKVPHTEKLREE